jgi:anti-sigma regulatory factor (Ser/Thr protein kinase)
MDMEAFGRNPARIIPAWRDFAEAHSGSSRRLRGIGEPIWPERSADELVECHLHEALLNLAFADASDFWLICPYDIEGLDQSVIGEARRTHPLVRGADGAHASADYMGAVAAAGPFAEPLPEPPVTAKELRFRARNLKAVREAVIREAAKAGLLPTRADDLALAVNELATNSIRHGGGEGTLRIWEEGGGLICEVRDRGRIEDPLVGRLAPGDDQVGGYGLWLANHVCDLVQVRSLADHSVVRVQMRRRPGQIRRADRRRAEATRRPIPALR